MSKQAVEEMMGRIITDPAFRESVRANPLKAAAGYDLTPDERRNLENFDVTEFCGLVDKMWDRASAAFGFTSN